MAGGTQKLLGAVGFGLALALAPSAGAVTISSATHHILPPDGNPDPAEVDLDNLCGSGGGSGCLPYDVFRLSELAGDYSATVTGATEIAGPLSASDPNISANNAKSWGLTFGMQWNGTLLGGAPPPTSSDAYLLFVFTTDRFGGSSILTSTDILAGFEFDTVNSFDNVCPTDIASCALNDFLVVQDDTTMNGGEGFVLDFGGQVGNRWVGLIFDLNQLPKEFAFTWDQGEPVSGSGDDMFRLFNAAFILVPEPAPLSLALAGLLGLALLGRRPRSA